MKNNWIIADKPDTIVDILRKRATHQGNRVAYTFLVDGETEASSITYGMLDQQARKIGASLQRAAPLGARVLLLFPSGLEFITAFLGCFYAGMIAVPAPLQRKRDTSRQRTIIQDAQPAIVLTHSSLLSHLEGLQTQHSNISYWISIDLLSTSQEDYWQHPAINADTIALLQYTSGSTATPKGIKVSHSNLLYNHRILQEAIRFPPEATIVSWLPLFHDMGLIGNILQALYLGIHCVFMSPQAFLQKPLRWLEAISCYQAYATVGPNFAYDLCAQKVTAQGHLPLDLSKWQIALVGSEPIRYETLQRFSSSFERYGFRWEAFYPCYGLAEATLFVSGSSRKSTLAIYNLDGAALEQKRIVMSSQPSKNTRTFIGCGHSWLGHKLKIVDPDSLLECPPNQVGEIWISGSSVAQGYWQQSEETTRTFQAYTANRREGPFLRTGDLGFIHKHELIVTGRCKDLIIIRGRNHYPQDIESTVEQSSVLLQPGSGAAFSIDHHSKEQLVIVQEIKRQHRHLDVEKTCATIRQAVAQQHELQVYAVILIKPGTLPKTTSGKIQRQACRAKFLGGDLNVIGSSIVDSTTATGNEEYSPPEGLFLGEQTLLQQVASLLHMKPSQVDAEQPLIALGLDSLAAMELKNLLEPHLGAKLTFAEILEGLSINQLITRIHEQGDADAGRSGSLSSYLKEVQKPEVRPPSLYERYAPLAFEQQRLWFIQQFEPNTTSYNVSVTIKLTGHLHREILEHCLNEIVQRHDILRTYFTTVDGSPLQAITQEQRLAVCVVDISGLTNEEKMMNLRRQVALAVQQPFDLSQLPLLRVLLLCSDKHEHHLLLVAHHIIFDFWSMVVLLKEAGALYEAFTQKSPYPLAHLPAQYADFAFWQQQMLQSQQMHLHQEYWNNTLAGAPPLLTLPTDYPRPNVQTFRGARHLMYFSNTFVERLNAFCHRQSVTPFMVMLTALTIVLSRWCQQEDMVIGSVVASRNQPETSNLIGCFMNFLPLRLRLADEETGQQLLLRLKSTLLEAYTHQDYPLEKILETLGLQRSSNYNPLYNVMLLMQNFSIPQNIRFSDQLHASLDTSIDSPSSLLDLRFIVGEKLCQEGMSLECEYNTDLFCADTIEQLVCAYSETVVQLIEYPGTKAALFPFAQDLQAQAKEARTREQKQLIVIAATFTAEPVEETLTFWMQELAIPATVKFAPYNQVFQQLLDSSSLLLENQHGVNVLLIKLDDWYAGKGTLAMGGKMGNADEFLETDVHNLINTLIAVSAHSATPYVICLCPLSPASQADTHRAQFLHTMEDLLTTSLKNMAGIYITRSDELFSLFPIANYYDPAGDELAHIPYTPSFFTALGTLIARRIYAFQKTPHKVLVLDCDQTLWNGISEEDGADHIEIDNARWALQEFVVAQYTSGVLICLCSKNDEEIVREVFERHPDMPLQREHILSWRINWLPKSRNLRSLAEELNLSLEHFIFIDDDPVECEEVQTYCPEVVTLQIPQDHENIIRFLNHTWIFDQMVITDTDRKRTALYRQQTERKQLRAHSLTFEEFLAALDLQVQVSTLASHQYSRVAQLTQRTNQFNCTMCRWTESDLQQLSSSSIECLVVEVRDRFGEYGLVGAILFETGAEAIRVNTFVLSCRVLGRKIEHTLLAQLARLANERGLRRVEIIFVPTKRNRQAGQFLEHIGGSYKRPYERGLLFELPVERALAVPTMAVVEEPEQASLQKTEALANHSFSRGRISGATISKISKELYDTEHIHQAIKKHKHKRPELVTTFVAPRTPTEKRLAAIWAELLGVEQVGIHDNFFDLGGHSLLAIQLISRVRDAFQMDLSPKALFSQAPTIVELATTIMRHQLQHTDEEVLIKIIEELNALSDEEVQSLLEEGYK